MILPKLRYQSLRNLYGVLHEADPSKAASVFGELLSEQAETNLARYRKARGFSQSQLANASGLSLRSIQLYEQLLMLKGQLQLLKTSLHSLIQSTLRLISRFTVTSNTMRMKAP